MTPYSHPSISPAPELSFGRFFTAKINHQFTCMLKQLSLYNVTLALYFSQSIYYSIMDNL